MEDFAGWKLIGSIVMAIMTTYVGESPYNRLGHFVTVQPELDTWLFVTCQTTVLNSSCLDVAHGAESNIFQNHLYILVIMYYEIFLHGRLSIW